MLQINQKCWTKVTVVPNPLFPESKGKILLLLLNPTIITTESSTVDNLNLDAIGSRNATGDDNLIILKLDAVDKSKSLNKGNINYKMNLMLLINQKSWTKVLVLLKPLPFMIQQSQILLPVLLLKPKLWRSWRWMLQLEAKLLVLIISNFLKLDAVDKSKKIEEGCYK